MATLTRRLVNGVGANGYGQIVSIATQLLSVPIFLAHWDISTYGKWLILTAIPSYFAMSDIGIVTVAKNKMTMLIGVGKNRLANVVFQSAQRFIFSVCGVLAALVLILILSPLPFLESRDYRIALGVLILSVLVGQMSGLAEAVYTATSRYAIGTFLSANARLGEWIGFMIGLFVFNSFAGVAVCGFLGKLLVVIFSMINSTYGRKDLSWGTTFARWSLVRALLRPALSFMTFTVSNALSFQGLTIIAGAALGPAAVVIFNTYRTFSRLAVQVTATIGHAMWPEFSKLFGAKGPQGIRLMYKRAAIGTLIGSWVLSLLLFILGPFILSVWTHDIVPFEPMTLLLFLVYAGIAGSVHTPRILLMATNNHIALGPISLIVSLITVVTGWLLANGLGVDGMAAAMILGEAVFLFICLYFVRSFFMPSVERLVNVK